MKIRNEVIAQIGVWANGYKSRNQDALLEADDFARIAEARWVEKSRYFSAEKGTLEQFTGMICNNVESELADALIADKEKRLKTDALDRPVGEDRDETLLDSLADAASGNRRFWLRYDVREAISLVRPKKLRTVLKLVMAGYSVRELARDVYHMPRNSFVYSHWDPAAEAFKKIFGHMQWQGRNV